MLLLSGVAVRPTNLPIADSGAIQGKVAELLEETRQSILLLLHGDCDAVDRLVTRGASPEASKLRALEVRCVVTQAALTRPAGAQRLGRLDDLGASIRYLSVVPQTIMLFDRHTALLASRQQSAGRRSGITVVHGQDVLVALASLGELLWDGAAALPPSAAARLTRQEVGVLRLLAEGHTDQVIARRIGVSVRTAGRLTATLMNRLDARSRFQAGVRAVQLGLLPSLGEQGFWADPRRRASMPA